MKKYVAETSSKGVQVLIHHSDQPDDTTPLEPIGGGFEWGYEGAGPRNLAWAILTDVVRTRFGEAFMKEVIATTSPIEEHRQVVVFREEQILDWLRKKVAQIS